MSAIFEGFVTTVLKAASPDGTIHSQRSHQYANSTDGHGRTLRTDLEITVGTTVRHILDTKYKAPEPRDSDLYQSHAYACALNVPSVTLVYAEPVTPYGFHIVDGGPEIRIRGVNLNADLAELIKQVTSLVPHETLAA